MANFVVKKDGTKEPFEAEKIRRAISAAGREAGVDEGRINEVASQVVNSVMEMAGAKEEIATSEIKEKVLGELDAIEPAISEAWRKYEQGR